MICAIWTSPNSFPQGSEEHICLRVWLPVCTFRLLLSHLNRIRQGRDERCGTSTIGSSSLISRNTVGSGVLRRGPWPLLAQTVSCQWSGSVSLNSTTPGLTRKSPSDSACPWMLRASECTAPTFRRCATLYALPGSRTEG